MTFTYEVRGTTGTLSDMEHSQLMRSGAGACAAVVGQDDLATAMVASNAVRVQAGMICKAGFSVRCIGTEQVTITPAAATQWHILSIRLDTTATAETDGAGQTIRKGVASLHVATSSQPIAPEDDWGTGIVYLPFASVRTAAGAIAEVRDERLWQAGQYVYRSGNVLSVHRPPLGAQFNSYSGATWTNVWHPDHDAPEFVLGASGTNFYHIEDIRPGTAVPYTSGWRHILAESPRHVPAHAGAVMTVGISCQLYTPVDGSAQAALEQWWIPQGGTASQAQGTVLASWEMATSSDESSGQHVQTIAAAPLTKLDQQGTYYWRFSAKHRQHNGCSVWGQPGSQPNHRFYVHHSFWSAI